MNGGVEKSEFWLLVVRRFWDVCVRNGIALVAEHLLGTTMIEARVDSLSRAAEFTVCWNLFRKMSKMTGVGSRGGVRGYTLDLYASKKTKKRRRYATKGALEGYAGDARTIDLGSKGKFGLALPLP